MVAEDKDNMAETEVKVKVETIDDKVEEIKNSNVVDNTMESNYG